MGCKDCELIHEEGQAVIPYRWKNAFVTIIACRLHGKEILEALNTIQQGGLTHGGSVDRISQPKGDL